MKLPVFCTPMVEIIDEAAEKSWMRIQVKHIFAVRHPKDSIISLVQVSLALNVYFECGRPYRPPLYLIYHIFLVNLNQTNSRTLFWAMR